jgi:hypothetical protein
MITAPATCQLLILFGNPFSPGIMTINEVFNALLKQGL